MKKKLLVIAALLGAFALVGLTGCDAENGETAFLDGVAKWDKKTLTVALPANPGTGYLWTYEITGEGAKYFQETSVSFSATDGEQPEGAGTMTYTFDLKGMANAKVKYTSTQPPEGSANPVSKTLVVKSQADGSIASLAVIS